MSHHQQQEFVKKTKMCFPAHFENAKVLEVGSLDINGTIRVFFEDCEYKGIDVGPGKCVDQVIGGHEIQDPDNYYDTVCSCECFEHNPHWVETFRNMYRMTRPGGLIFMTCASSGRSEHGTSKHSPDDSPHTVQWDYYRNLEQKDFEDHFSFSEMFSEFLFHFERSSADLYFAGLKR